MPEGPVGETASDIVIAPLGKGDMKASGSGSLRFATIQDKAYAFGRMRMTQNVVIVLFVAAVLILVPASLGVAQYNNSDKASQALTGAYLPFQIIFLLLGVGAVILCVVVVGLVAHKNKEMLRIHTEVQTGGMRGRYRAPSLSRGRVSPFAYGGMFR